MKKNVKLIHRKEMEANELNVPENGLMVSSRRLFIKGKTFRKVETQKVSVPR